MSVEVRQAHPGPGAPPHRTQEEKSRSAEAFVREHHIPWTVLVDDLEGTVHKQYAELPDPSFLIGTDGRVAFVDYWTHVPRLHTAIERLLEMGGSGVLGAARIPHPLATMVDGWPGIRRGLPQSFIELETAGPGLASSVWLGWQLRALLAPLARRSLPMPRSQQLVLAGAALVLGAGAATVMRRLRPALQP